jgi:hypothetical protein
MNPLLMKLTFGVLTKPNELWVQVLREIYYEFLKNKVILKGKRQLFYTWRSIVSVWEQMLCGTKWNINNGKEV